MIKRHEEWVCDYCEKSQTYRETHSFSPPDEWVQSTEAFVQLEFCGSKCKTDWQEVQSVAQNQYNQAMLMVPARKNALAAL